MVSGEGVLTALGLPADTPFTWEPFGEAPGSPVRVFIEGAQPMEL